MKKTIISLLTLSVIGIVMANNTSALTYSDNVGVNFTFSPSLSVSLSSASGGSNADLVINDLTPGTSSDSNIIIVNVLTNNTNGYELKSNVGNNTTYVLANRDLVLLSALPSSVTSSTPKFNSIDYGASESSLTVDNTWGYSYLDETLTGSTWSNYSGLPLYSDTEHTTTLKTTNGPSLSTGDNIDFKIAAKASTTQASGEYNNVINFIAVGNPNPVSFYDAFKEAASQPGSTITQLNGYYKMQDMSPSICNAVDVYDDDSHIQLIDTRDHEVYWIGKLRDDRCWLLDNLRLGSNDYEIELTPQDTNIETAWTLPKSTTSSTWSTTVPRIYANNKDVVTTRYGTASGKVGIYYNYCATSGGTYCYPENEGVGDAQYSVCPKGWLLPTDGPGSNYGTLSNFYSEDAIDASSLQYNLSMPLSGNMDLRNWVPVSLNYKGFYWTSSKYDDSGTSYAGSHMYHVEVTSSHVSKSTAHYRYNMYTLRCIANN